jgi:hypothetical protein
MQKVKLVSGNLKGTKLVKKDKELKLLDGVNSVNYNKK